MPARSSIMSRFFAPRTKRYIDWTIWTVHIKVGLRLEPRTPDPYQGVRLSLRYSLVLPLHRHFPAHLDRNLPHRSLKDKHSTVGGP